MRNIREKNGMFRADVTRWGTRVCGQWRHTLDTAIVDRDRIEKQIPKLKTGTPPKVGPKKHPRDYYYARQRAGLCGRCGSVPEIGIKTCRECLNIDKAKRTLKRHLIA